MGTYRSNLKQYIALKEAGLCVRCGSEAASKGKLHCETCLKKHSQDNAQRYQKLKAECEDRCSHCRRNKPSPGMKTCASCRILRNAEYRRNYKKAQTTK